MSHTASLLLGGYTDYNSGASGATARRMRAMKAQAINLCDARLELVRAGEGTLELVFTALRLQINDRPGSSRAATVRIDEPEIEGPVPSEPCDVVDAQLVLPTATYKPWMPVPIEGALVLTLTLQQGANVCIKGTRASLADDAEGWEDSTHITLAARRQKAASKGDDCLVVIYTPRQADLGKLIPLGSEPLTIGRYEGNEIVLEGDSISRHHCRIERRGDKCVVRDLKSTNGTLLNDKPLKQPRELHGGDQIRIANVIFKYLSGADLETQYHETVYGFMRTDELTGALVRRHFEEALEREIARAHRHQRPLSLVLLDIDHFKAINDTYGHPAGDQVLRDLSAILRSRLRPEDSFARYGGEEFVLILPETPLEGAKHLAEEARRLVQDHAFVVTGRLGEGQDPARREDERVPVTISVGIAELAPGMSGNELVGMADQKLYVAKEHGRNRVCG